MVTGVRMGPVVVMTVGKGVSVMQGKAVTV